ncbi:hypothetical protein FB645_000931 [Coemansia sp. IMI 203386]|nr:hypothetical protein FB645_000931 [Coemansia sp. IMI 203386]
MKVLTLSTIFLGLISISSAANVDRGLIRRRFPKRFMSTTIDNECSVANGCKSQETASVTPIVYVNHIPKRQLSQSFEFAKRKDGGKSKSNGDGDGDGDGNDSDSDNEDDDDKETERGNKNSSTKGTNDNMNANFRINLAVNNNSTTTKDFGNSNSNGNIKSERKSGRNSSNEVENDGETEDDKKVSSKEPTDNENKYSNKFTNFQVNYAADNNSTNTNSHNKNSFGIKKENTNKNTDKEVNNDNNDQDGTTPVTTEGPFTGTGIPYSPAEETCSNQSYSDNDLVVALNKQQYGDADVSEFCGKCVEVTGDSAKMVFTIVGVCDDCEYGGIEIAQNVYSQLISDENSGDISWDFVDC